MEKDEDDLYFQRFLNALQELLRKRREVSDAS